MRTALFVGIGATILAAAACDSPLGSTEGCTGGVAYTVMSTVSGAVEEDDCLDEQDRVGDYYHFALTGQTNFQLTMQANGFQGELRMYAGKPASPNAKLIFESVGPGTPGGNVFLPAGPYFIIAGTAGNSGGDYTLVSQPASTNGCPQHYNWTYPGATMSGTITTNDCAGADIARQDVFGLWLTAGQTVTVNGLTDKQAAMLWRSGDGTTPNLISRSLTGGTAAQFNFTAPRSDAFRVHMNGAPSAVGAIAYTVTIQ